MLRTKKDEDGTYNENSYNAPDSVNNLKWDELSTTSEQYKTMQYYKGLIAFRKATPALRSTTVSSRAMGEFCKMVKRDKAFLAFTIQADAKGDKLLIIYNPYEEEKDFTLPAGNWNLYINGETAGTTAIATGVSGAVKIAPISCYVYKLAA